mmetsp:Transcript_23887/g.24115  ORF Transcript_23887/g.24115 Transcript_23887/m.24115 type:complete len:97 (-) Transcript_23887:96-386(-)
MIRGSTAQSESVSDAAMTLPYPSDDRDASDGSSEGVMLLEGRKRGASSALLAANDSEITPVGKMQWIVSNTGMNGTCDVYHKMKFCEWLVDNSLHS